MGLKGRSGTNWPLPAEYKQRPLLHVVKALRQIDHKQAPPALHRCRHTGIQNSNGIKSCYLNSVVQAIAATPPLAAAIAAAAVPRKTFKGASPSAAAARRVVELLQRSLQLLNQPSSNTRIITLEPLVCALGAFRPNEGFVPGSPGCPIAALDAIFDAAKEMGVDLDEVVAARGRSDVLCDRGCANRGVAAAQRQLVLLPPGCGGGGGGGEGRRAGLAACLEAGVPLFGEGCRVCYSACLDGSVQLEALGSAIVAQIPFVSVQSNQISPRSLEPLLAPDFMPERLDASSALGGGAPLCAGCSSRGSSSGGSAGGASSDGGLSAGTSSDGGCGAALQYEQCAVVLGSADHFLACTRRDGRWVVQNDTECYVVGHGRVEDVRRLVRTLRLRPVVAFYHTDAPPAALRRRPCGSCGGDSLPLDAAPGRGLLGGGGGDDEDADLAEAIRLSLEEQEEQGAPQAGEAGDAAARSGGARDDGDADELPPRPTSAFAFVSKKAPAPAPAVAASASGRATALSRVLSRGLSLLSGSSLRDSRAVSLDVDAAPGAAARAADPAAMAPVREEEPRAAAAPEAAAPVFYGPQKRTAAQRLAGALHKCDKVARGAALSAEQRLARAREEAAAAAAGLRAALGCQKGGAAAPQAQAVPSGGETELGGSRGGGALRRLLPSCLRPRAA